MDQIADKEKIRRNDEFLGRLKLIENEIDLIGTKIDELAISQKFDLRKQAEFVEKQKDLVYKILVDDKLADLVALKLVTKEKIIQNLNQFSNQLKEATDGKEIIFEDAYNLITELCNLLSFEVNSDTNLTENDSILSICNSARLQIINKLNKNLNYAIANSIQSGDKTELIKENEDFINLAVQSPNRISAFNNDRLIDQLTHR